MLSISDLKNVDDESRGKLLGKLLPYLGYDGGPQFLRDLWKRSKCTWEDFVVDGDVKRFIESNVSIRVVVVVVDAIFNEFCS